MTTMNPTKKEHCYPLAENAPMVEATEATRANKHYIGGLTDFDPTTIQVRYSGKFDKNLDPARFAPFFKALDQILNNGKEKYGQNLPKIHGGTIDEQVKDAIWEHIYVPFVIPGHLTIADLSAPGFNRWLMNVAFDGAYCRFLAWRHGDDGAPVNWGLGVFEAQEAHFSRILFFRLHFVYHALTASQTPDFGSGLSDFWRSGITRRNVRGRYRVQAKADLKRNSQVSTPGERVFSKAETVWGSNHRMDHLDKAGCDKAYADIETRKYKLTRDK